MTIHPDVSGFDEARSAEVVAASFGGGERLQLVLGSLVKHLHAFAKDVELSLPEWEAGVDFLTRTGQKCDALRQEFILLSDVLGLSMLVETMNNRSEGGTTESTVLGPFHMVTSPVRPLGAQISLDGKGQPALVTGRVLDQDGQPVPQASVDVWQASADGFYDVQQPGIQPELNLRGLFTAEDDGSFWFRTIVPRFYPIPTDGPVGELLAATHRHPNRPAHIHFLVTAPGHRPLTTHIFEAGSRYLDSDAVFAVKPSLVREFTHIDDAARAAELGLDNPFRELSIDLVLVAEP